MSLTILLVDDDEDLLHISSITIQLTCDWKLLTAPEGNKAIALAKQHIPDLILLDYMMPEVTGLVVLEKLREDPATCSIPIVFFTASCDNQTVEMLLDAGAVGVIGKPFEPLALVPELRGYLKQHLSGGPDKAD